MQGIVKGLSQNRQRAAVLTDTGYTVFDLVHGEVEVNDVISGDLASHGSQDLSNLTTTHTLSVHIEAIQATTSGARSLLKSR